MLINNTSELFDPKKDPNTYYHSIYDLTKV